MVWAKICRNLFRTADRGAQVMRFRAFPAGFARSPRSPGSEGSPLPPGLAHFNCGPLPDARLGSLGEGLDATFGSTVSSWDPHVGAGAALARRRVSGESGGVGRFAGLDGCGRRAVPGGQGVRTRRWGGRVSGWRGPTGRGRRLGRYRLAISGCGRWPRR